MNKHFGKHLAFGALALGITATLFSQGVYAAASTSAPSVTVPTKAVVVKGTIKSVPATALNRSDDTAGQVLATVVVGTSSSGEKMTVMPSSALVSHEAGEVLITLPDGKKAKAIPATPCTKAIKVIK